MENITPQEIPPLQNQSHHMKWSHKLLLGLFIALVIIIVTLFVQATISIFHPNQSKSSGIHVLNSTPDKVLGIVGQPIGVQTTFSSSTFIVTSDQDSGNAYLYRLRDGMSHQIKGLPSHFVSPKFYPTKIGLVLAIPANVSPNLDFYLIDAKNDDAKIVNNNLPGEIYTDATFDGTVAYSSQNKNVYMLDDNNNLSNPIDISSYSKQYNDPSTVPNIFVANYATSSMKAWPHAYVSQPPYFLHSSSTIGISYLDFQNQNLKNIQDQNGTTINNICAYTVYQNELWFVTCNNGIGTIWKTQDNVAARVTTFNQDGLAQPSLNVLDGDALTLSNGTMMSLVTDTGLKLIAQSKVWNENMCVAKIGTTIYCSCSYTMSGSGNLCSYSIDQLPDSAKKIGYISGGGSRTLVKSSYDNNYYIRVSYAEGGTYYYVLSQDGSFYDVDSHAELAMSDTSGTNSRTNSFVNVVGRGEVRHYTIPGELFSQGICDYNACGSDENGYYYLAIKSETPILNNTGYPATYEGIYYLKK